MGFIKFKPILLLAFPFVAILLALRPAPTAAWGFFGHRKINRMAVFTLPPEMLVFYKKNVDWLTEHAVDPDMRRYASKHEAPRHFLDLDRYGEPPFEELPRVWTDALMQYFQYFYVNERGDTLRLITAPITEESDSVAFNPRIFKREKAGAGSDVASPKGATRKDFRRFFNQNILSHYYDDEKWSVPCDSLANLLGGGQLNCRKIFVLDTFSQHGVLPYNLEQMLKRLTDAFVEHDEKRILHYSADIGHYIADAHVPLHTSMNYNGQMTGQDGLHAFWETRLPELYADEQYDFWVGQADFIEKPKDYFWKIVLDSYALVDSVIGIERSLRKQFPPDRQMCNEYRNNVFVKTQCEDFAAAYHERMSGMVEDRMQGAIRAVGSAWYTAWVLAGQPDLSNLGEETATLPDSTEIELKKAVNSGKQLGRGHEN
ncbi:MAG: hypothetical protein K9J45_13930 [Bacteroidales bacterium]|nr:hypothetical protein [Bacteroidales bacterium]